MELPTSPSARPRPTQMKIWEALARLRGWWQQAAKVGGSFFAVFSSSLAVVPPLILVLAVAVDVSAVLGVYHAAMNLSPSWFLQTRREVERDRHTTFACGRASELIAMLVIGL